MEYDHENRRIKGFELKFKSLDKDIERYRFALLDLLEAGKIELVPPAKSLIASHYDEEGYAWIMDSYFEKGLFDLVEQYFTPAGEVLFPPSATTRRYLDRMLDTGQSACVRRIWRAYIGLMKSEYWFLVKERDQGHTSTIRISASSPRPSSADVTKNLPCEFPSQSEGCLASWPTTAPCW
jgi:hypothetical protein